MPSVSVLMKPASGMCNLNCGYCFYRDETAKRVQENYGFMEESTLKNVIRRTMLQAEGMAAFAFQGGEPTLRGIDFFRKAIEYEKQYNKNKLKVTNVIQTNGTLIDDEWCAFFKANQFLVGLSVDGTQLTHDAYRRTVGGEPTFERVLKAAELFDRYQVQYNILTVVNRRVAENIGDIYGFYRDKNWNYQQYIACLDPLGEVHGQQEYSLTPECYGQFLIELFGMWFADLKKGRQPFIRQFDNYVGILQGYMPEACDMRGCCGVQYVVEADGGVYPCDFYMMDKYYLGNFNTDRLPEIDAKRQELRFIENSRALTENCRECEYYQLCRGGCRRHWDSAADEHNCFCKSYRMFFDKCRDRLKESARLMR